MSGLGNVLDLGLFFLKCLIIRHFKHTENNIADTSCLTTVAVVSDTCDPMDCGRPGSSVHGIL